MRATIYSQRKRFDAELMAELRPLLKQTGWRKAQNALFTQTGEYFQDVLVCVNCAEAKTTIEWSIKPMAIDPILWAIDDCQECLGQPLSFRSWGINTCKALPILEAEVETAGDAPKVVAQQIVDLCLSRVGAFRELLATAPFSALIAAYPAQVGRGAFETTHVIALIGEGDIECARRIAIEYACRQRESGHPIFSKGSFHEQIVAWLDGGGPSRMGLRLPG